MRKSYPSDISREQFEEIRKELVEAKKATHPRKYDLYGPFCAVLYLLKEGAHGGPSHTIFRNGKMCAIIMIYGQALTRTESVSLTTFYVSWWNQSERKNGRTAQTTMLIVDSKSIQNADTAEAKGYDAGKKCLE